MGNHKPLNKENTSKFIVSNMRRHLQLLFVAHYTVFKSSGFSVFPTTIATTIRRIRTTSNPAFNTIIPSLATVNSSPKRTTIVTTTWSSSPTSVKEKEEGEDGEEELKTGPRLDGSILYPMKVLSVGLKNQKVPAVYAVFNNSFKSAGGDGEGWEYCEYIGVTRDLNDSLESLLRNNGGDVIASVRALSFAYPQRTAMEEVAMRWAQNVDSLGGKIVEVGNGLWSVVEMVSQHDKHKVVTEMTTNTDMDMDIDTNLKGDKYIC